MNKSLCNKGERCTQSQRAAAKHFEGPLLIVAGPGADKTRVLVEIVAYLVKKKKVEPSSILVNIYSKSCSYVFNDIKMR